MFRLSQGHLKLLETCPRQFQRVYLEQRQTPKDPERMERIERGNRFHLLMQQRELGLPIGPLLEAEPEIKNAFLALANADPEITKKEGQTFREAEHARTLTIGDYLFTVIYDLLIVRDDRAIVYDWKTYFKPENRKKLALNWQTRLYPYVLARTTTLEPENISMVYWFTGSPDKPESIAFKYDRQLHDRTERELKNLLKELTGYLEDYREKKIDFPHRPGCERHCPDYIITEKPSLSLEDMEEIDPFV